MECVCLCYFFLNPSLMNVEPFLISSDFIFYEMILLIEYVQRRYEWHVTANISQTRKPRSVFQEAPGIAASLSKLV